MRLAASSIARGSLSRRWQTASRAALVSAVGTKSACTPRTRWMNNSCAAVGSSGGTSGRSAAQSMARRPLLLGARGRAREVKGHARLLAHDPRIVSRWNIERVVGADVHFRAMGHDHGRIGAPMQLAAVPGRDEELDGAAQ